MTLGTAQGVRSRALGRRPDCGKGRLSARIRQPEGHGRAFFQRCEFRRFTVTVTRGMIAAYRVRRAGSSVRTHTPGWWRVSSVPVSQSHSSRSPFIFHFHFTHTLKGMCIKMKMRKCPGADRCFVFQFPQFTPNPLATSRAAAMKKAAVPDDPDTTVCERSSIIH